MTTATKSDANLPNEEGLEIKYIGKTKRQYTDVTKDDIPWTYTPSGRMCTRCECINFQDIGEVNTFTFIDLVDKVTFEVSIIYSEEDEIEIDNFYFSAEDELVIINAWSGHVKQLVYKLDCAQQTLELQETILHEFNYENEYICFSPQQNKFVSVDGIDYLVIVSFGEEYLIPNGSLFPFTVYMMPLNPKDKNAPLKEYQFHLTEETYANAKKNVESYLTENRLGERSLKLDSESCFIHKTKLYFSFRITGLPIPNRDLGVPQFRPLTEDDLDPILIGAYWEVDLAKLKDISARTLSDPQNIRQLMEEQVDAGKFVQYGDLHVAKKIYFYHFEKNIGLFYIYHKKQVAGNDISVAILYPSNLSESSKAITLDWDIPNENGTHKDADRFTVHPHGALLSFEYDDYHIKKGSPIIIRVLKQLKNDLMSLSLNKVLMHKDSPIKYHKAYKLCFYGVEYKNNYITRKSLKRKLPEE